MKKLILFTVTDIKNMLKKGNVWYLRHYERYFDKVYVVYILGNGQKPITNGNTTLVTLGTGNRIKNLFLAPYRLYRFARKIKQASYLTADPLFLWWTSFFLKRLLGAKIFFMPVSMPEEIYKFSKKSFSGVPLWLEREFLRLSIMAADSIIVTRNDNAFIEYFSSIKYARNKVRVVDMIVEEMPTEEFYRSLDEEIIRPSINERILLYVGRLHREKMVDDIIKAFAYVQKRVLNAKFRIIGDGVERKNLEDMAIKLGIKDKVDFLGPKPNSELVKYYKSADVFVSPLTGSSLRESALCKLPVVAYKLAWVAGFLVHEKNSLLVASGNIEGLAWQIIRVLEDKELAKNLSETLFQYALERWHVSKIEAALEQTFANS